MKEEFVYEPAENASTSPTTEPSPPMGEGNNKRFIVLVTVAILVILALIVLATVFLVNPQNSAITEQIRDVFIIFMALESLIIGIALVVLIVQLATLINLLQNEIKPIINSTHDTVNTLKGTAQFLSNNLTEPVIKVNQYVAMLKKLIKPSKR